MKNWTVFASGGSGKNEWEEEKEVQAETISEAAEQSGFEEEEIDGIISDDLMDSLELEPDREPSDCVDV